jgi:hypothetical protein
MKNQTATQDSHHQPRYDVWSGRTPDEKNAKFKNFAASFHKLLQHHPDTGLLTDHDDANLKNGVDSYNHLLNGLEIHSPSSGFNQDELNKIRLAVDPAPPPQKRRVIINPQSGKSLTIKGGDSAAYVFKKIPIADEEKAWSVGYEVRYAEDGDTKALLDELSFRTGYTAAEMIEVYAMALLRDLKFSEYSTAFNNNGHPKHNDIHKAIDALNAFGDEFRGPKEKQANGTYKVTVKTLFRGNSPESLRGDYLSKFYLLKRPPQFASGCAPGTANLTNAQIFFNVDDFAEKYLVPPPNPNSVFGIIWNHYVDIQNGLIPKIYQLADFIPHKELISTGLILASSVHLDSLYQEHAWAVDVLTGGDYPRTPVSPYTKPPDPNAFSAPNEGDGPTLGPPDAAGIVGAVALEAARAAWGQKYVVARRARPEVFAALLHKRLYGGDANTYGPLDNRLLANGTPVNALLNRIKEENVRLGEVPRTVLPIFSHRYFQKPLRRTLHGHQATLL